MNGHEIKIVTDFVYLGQKISSKKVYTSPIYKSLMSSEKFSATQCQLDDQKRLREAYVQLRLTYGVQAYVLNGKTI